MVSPLPSGLDRYRDDHPVMQFAAHQLDLMNRGYSKNAAFKIVRQSLRKKCAIFGTVDGEKARLIFRFNLPFVF